MSDTCSIDLFNKKGETVGTALYDKIDHALVSQYKWHMHKFGYALGNRKVNDKVERILMHQLVAHNAGIVLPEGHVIDHQDRNRRNNQRANLRSASRSENAQNRTKQADASSQYKGVSWREDKDCWVLQYGGKYLGLYMDEKAAAWAYNEHVKSIMKDPFLNDVEMPDKDYKKPTRKKHLLPKGVSLASSGKFRGTGPGVDGKRSTHLGTFQTKEEAARAVEVAYTEHAARKLKLMQSRPITRNTEGIAVLLTGNNEEILVDDDRWHELSAWSWNLCNSGYASAGINGKTVLLHRWLTHATKGMVIDHIDNCKADNRLQNLRECQDAENGKNKSKREHSSSCFHGVTFQTNKNKWEANVCVNGTKTYLGQYDDETVAAWVRDCRVKELADSFIKLNNVETPSGWKYENCRGVYVGSTKCDDVPMPQHNNKKRKQSANDRAEEEVPSPIRQRLIVAPVHKVAAC